MDTLTARLPFKNEGKHPVKLCIEPYCEFFEISSGQKVIVHAICAENVENLEFSIVYDDSYLTIYAPGAPTGLIDVYVTLDNVKLTPT